jgi:putative transposase
MESKRRKRVRHYDEPGHAHFLTFSCYRRLPLLGKERSCLWLVQAIQQARVKHGFDLWAWVIMPDHVHLLIWPSAGTATAEILRSIKVPVARKALFYLRRQAPAYLKKLAYGKDHDREYRFWQAGPGYDKNVIEPAQVYELIEYIHQNPVKRGLAARATDWKWSSARAWEGWDDLLLSLDRESMPPMVHTER